jgi:hypothetical protein
MLQGRNILSQFTQSLLNIRTRVIHFSLLTREIQGDVYDAHLDWHVEYEVYVAC